MFLTITEIFQINRFRTALMINWEEIAYHLMIIRSFLKVSVELVCIANSSLLDR